MTLVKHLELLHGPVGATRGAHSLLAHTHLTAQRAAHCDQRAAAKSSTRGTAHSTHRRAAQHLDFVSEADEQICAQLHQLVLAVDITRAIQIVLAEQLL